MARNSLEYFVGRQATIGQFEGLLASEHKPWVMLVDGLSGTGKSLLVDWLSENRCKNTPHASITLTISANSIDLINLIAEQVDPDVSTSYEQGLKELDASEERQSLVNLSPTLGIGAMANSTVSGGTQSVSLDTVGLAGLIREERETKRLDLLVKTLEQCLKNRVWVLFIDEASYLENPELERFVLVKMVARLHNRFPRFRLYLTGQSVPTKFDHGERLQATLEPFPVVETGQLLSKAGIEDPKLQKSVFAVSLGHPLLTAMLVEYILEAGPNALKADEKRLERMLNDGQRTEWIYDRILDNISDPAIREIAANLSLFDWFDLSLLRKVFNYELHEKDFAALVRRSFVKAMEGGRWRCHDIILKNLRPQRISLLQDESQQVYRRIFEALQERLARQEAKDAMWGFPARINLTSAALSALLEVSLSEAHAFLLTEIAQSYLFDFNYIYPLIRLVENRPATDVIRQEVDQAKQYFEAVNLEQYTVKLAAYVDRLGQHLLKQGKAAPAIKLEQIAAVLFSSFDKHEQAIACMQRASAQDDSLQNRQVLARVMIQAGQLDAAQALLAKSESQFGDQAELQIERSRLAFAQEKGDEGRQILFDAIARYPDSVEAHERLLEVIVTDTNYEAALALAESILKLQPGNSSALMTKIGLLSQLGRFDEALSLVRTRDLSIASAMDGMALVTGMLNDPLTRGRLLAELELNPESVAPNTANIMMVCFSIRGDVKTTDMLARVAEVRSPEVRPLAQSYRAVARMMAGQRDEARSIAEALIRQDDGLVDAYLVAASCHLQEARIEEATKLFGELIERFPYARDMAEAAIASAFLAKQQPEAALAYLDQAAELHKLEPLSLEKLAEVFIRLGRADEARPVLEELIYTAERSELPIQNQLTVRVKYATLLVQSGEREKASAIAHELLTLNIDPSLTAPQAVQIFVALQDEAGLRTAFQTTDNWDPTYRIWLLGLLANFILQRNTDLEGLLSELEIHPDRLEIMGALDRFLTENNMIEEIQGAMQRAEGIAPGIFMSYMSVQQAYFRQAGPDQIQQVRAAIVLENENIRLHIILSRLLLAQGLFQEAKKAFDEVVRLNPALREFAVNLQTAALLEVGELETAQGLLEPYLEMQPPPQAALEPVLNYLAERGDHESEMKIYESAARAYPNLRHVFIEKAADNDIAEGHNEHAIELIDQLGATEMLGPGLVISRANALRNLKRYDEALASCDEMLSRRNLTPLLQSIFRDHQATTYRAAGRIQEAFTAGVEAVTLDKGNPRLRFNLAEICQLIEEWDLAYDSILNGLALDPAKLPEYQETLRTLAARRGLAGPGQPATTT